MNGFLKARSPLLFNPPRLERGVMVIEADYRPVLNRDSIARQRLAMHSARRASQFVAHPTKERKET